MNGCEKNLPLKKQKRSCYSIQVGQDKTSNEKLGSRYYDLFLLLILIGIGIVASIFAGVSVLNQNKQFLLKRSNTIAVSLPANNISKLQGNSNDLDSSNYIDLKNKLTQIRVANPDIKFAYLTGVKNGEVYFNADSEPSTSIDYSPPGQSYPEASEEFKESFTNKNSFVEGPYRDRWGTWFSALAPIIDNQTSKVVAVVGIDSSATSVYLRVLLYSLIPILFISVPVIEIIRQRKVKQKEKEVLELKNHFVSIASHELRSPLSGIMWALQSTINKGKNLTTGQIELLSDIYVSAESTLETVNEILDLSIFERGKADNIQQEPLDLANVMSQVMKSQKLGAKEKDIILHTSKTWPKEINILGDANALKRAFTNVISNSIKYSPETSQITIGYQFQDNMHVISVEDAGIGIAEKEINKVMQGYYRAPNASKIQAHGTGLGVFVTKLVIEQHKGKFWIQSQENVGTTIFMGFPEYKGPVIPQEQVLSAE